jgi:DNA polymerase (family 10)
VLRSMEVDILRDGSLDMDDETLEGLDVVLVSVHSFMRMNSAAMTERVVRALQHPLVDILGHPTGRMLGRRPPFAVDMDAVLQAAAELDVAVEINANPNRLDLSDVHAFRARELGVKIVVSTDAHNRRELDNMHFGVDQARRAWCEAGDVLNTRSWAAFEAWLNRRAA